MKKKTLALTLACALGLALLSGCTQDPKETQQVGTDTPTPAALGQVTFEDTVAWDGQYDVVVIGFGGAGAVAARTAADEGANVLIVEKAPEGHEGGNTRYCGQLVVYGNGNYDDTFAYYKGLAGNHAVNEDALSVYCKGIANSVDLISDMFGVDKNDIVDVVNNPVFTAMSPEYPELPGSGSISLMSSHAGATSDAYLWNLMRQAIVDRADQIDVWFESPAVHLIQDPVSKTILGVQVERGGKTLNIRANNGVVMACGGFENNDEMCETYLGFAEHGVMGTLYNTGDGLVMAQEVGAQMWHLRAYEGASMSPVVDEGMRGIVLANPAFRSGSSMVISGAGTRFMNETADSRHGHILYGDVYENPTWPQKIYVLFDETQYQTALAYDSAMGAYSFLNGYDHITQASSLKELAEKMDMDYDVLAKTVNDFNFFVETGIDYETGRDVSTMSTFHLDQNVYAVEMVPMIMNTQGGPMRDENAQIIGVGGEPIPHLYSAGEFGGITALQYQGGGNMAECLIFGQIAGKNAAAAKEYASAALTKTETNVIYTVGVESDIDADVDVVLGENEYLGIGAGGMGGDIALKVKIIDGNIESIEIVREKETPERFEAVKNQLIPAIIEANSTEVDAITNSTMSSNAVKAAVEDALSKAK